ncbi:hypothetical protein E4U27_007418 [Claviceps purpurea]|nr:hypothetical protein E4U27_007418 [Claviceps purpurea]
MSTNISNSQIQLQRHETLNFQLLKPADREASILQLPDDAVAFFHRFCPESLIEKWVVRTSSWATFRIEQRVNAADSEDSNDIAEGISVLRWISTTAAKIYIFLHSSSHLHGQLSGKTHRRSLG